MWNMYLLCTRTHEHLSYYDGSIVCAECVCSTTLSGNGTVPHDYDKVGSVRSYSFSVCSRYVYVGNVFVNNRSSVR